MKIRTPAILLFLFIFMCLPAPVYALTSADALPKGVRAAAIVYGFAPQVDSSFTQDGELDFLVSPLNRSVSFEEMAETETDLRTIKNVIDSIYPENIGNQLLQADLYADAQVYEQRYVPALLWGFTDRFSLGALFPIVKRKVSAGFEARVYNQGEELEKLVGDTPELNEAAELLKNANVDTKTFADAIFTKHGYTQPGNFEKNGIGDFELEARYLYYKSDRLNAGARLGLRFPTAQNETDLTNLLDQPLGKGDYGLKLGLVQDFKPFGANWIFSSGFFAIYNFSSTVTKVIQRSDEQILPDLKDPYQIEEVNRSRGIDINTDVAVSRAFFRRKLWLAASYIFAFHGTDKYSGSRDLDYASLSNNTRTTEHGFEISVEVSSIQMFLDEEFPIPGKLVFAWYQPVAGTNALYAPFGRMDFAMLF